MTFGIALAVAAVQAAGERAGAVLEHVAGPDGEAARVEATRLLALPRDVRAAELAIAATRLRAPRPPGFDEIHPEWRGEDLRVDDRAAAPVRVWVERRAFGHLVAMPGPGEIRGPADLPRARPDWLALRIERVGLRQLAHATAGAPAVELAALAARLGLRGKPYIEAVSKIRELGDAAAAVRHGPRRAAQARCEGIRLGRDRFAFLAIGARAVAPHVASVGGDVARQLAQRLPMEPGKRVLAELHAWRHTALDNAPVWGEIL